ncbi:MAG TPA: aldo/keto reductase [Anaerolineaceae bacterium]|nr:aldo/keto reductase [Anaerolineaceae bacterium]
MYTISLTPEMQASALVLGCMRLTRLTGAELDLHLKTALDLGVNFFDHADIYGGFGACERHFGEWLRANASLRPQMLIQSKCGIVQNEARQNVSFDFSYGHILKSVDNSLQNLGIEQLDVLLLHRPDALFEPEEVAAAFDELTASGKVRAFGVSNMHSGQIELLQSATSHKLIANQLQFGPGHTGMINHAIRMNTNLPYSEDRDSVTLDYCRLHGMTIQAWSPYQYGLVKGTYMDNPDYPGLNAALEEVGRRYGISKNGAVAAWIARHPAKMQIIVGTMNTQRLREIAAGMDIPLSREDWYRIYTSEGRDLP